MTIPPIRACPQVGTFEELQHFSLRSIRRKASDLAGGRADAPEASPAGPAGLGATGCEGARE